jgi:D-glycero-D-manno-heptose 1,7-bisphosphate phosphatase
LDRDGTLNEPPEPGGYILLPEDLRLVPGAAEAVRRFKEAGFFLCLVTNQRCVGIGLISPEQLDAIHQRLRELLRAEGGVELDAIQVCVDDRDSPRRKPHPTMLLEAAEEFGLDLARSWMIGDSIKDVKAGLAAGTRVVLIEHPGTTDERQNIAPEMRGKIETASSLEEAAEMILARKER